MPKTVIPGTVTVNGRSFRADAVPDVFDERDLEYRPKLASLPPTLDQRGIKRLVLTQTGNSCTGHAVAGMINTVLAGITSPDDPQPKKAHLNPVSPYMLYRLARRYDEFQGEADEGSSLRGVFKGWFHHGVALSRDFPALETDQDLDDPAFADRCRDRPLGAYYRISALRLDDMQSAVTELGAIAVSAVIHGGWTNPVAMKRGGEQMRVIARRVNSRSLGGHAFALVGYNEVGFLVQNSWGKEWGKGGFATLPYEDWLDSAYDAWVARPGVPQTPFASGRQRATATKGRQVTAPGPDLARLAMHVVNLGNNGQLSGNGQFVSTPEQIDRLFAHMDRWHSCWLEQGEATARDVVLYAHGGLISESSGLEIAQKHLNWWLNNHMYPVSFSWQSGPAETLVDALADALKGALPFGGVGIDFLEQWDRRVERFARSNISWMWSQMKQNAMAASKPLSATSTPGATLTVGRLKQYIDRHGADHVKVHLVGHSAGSIFHAGTLGPLSAAGIKIESMALLAPAIRIDQFQRDILPHLGTTVGRFVTFAMTDQRELDDSLGVGRLTIYNKSLLYLVSHALEGPVLGDQGEVPLLGMEKFFDRPLSGTAETLREAIANRGGTMVFSRSDAPEDSRSSSQSHGGFDDDSDTMTSVVMRALGRSVVTEVEGYTKNAALKAVQCFQPVGARVPPAPEGPVGRGARASAGPPPLKVGAVVNPPSQAPVVETAEPQHARPVGPRLPGGRVMEVAVAPASGSSIVDQLIQSQWRVADTAGQAAGSKRVAKRSPSPRNPSRK